MREVQRKYASLCARIGEAWLTLSMMTTEALPQVTQLQAEHKALNDSKGGANGKA